MHLHCALERPVCAEMAARPMDGVALLSGLDFPRFGFWGFPSVADEKKPEGDSGCFWPQLPG